MSWLKRRLGYGVWGYVDTDNPTEPPAVTVNRQPGTWGYDAGTSGTEVISSGRRVISITAHCTTAGSMTIDGGDTITIPATSSLTIRIDGVLVAPTLIFTGTDAYIVQWVS